MSDDFAKPLDRLLASAQANIPGTTMGKTTQQMVESFPAPGSLDAIALATGMSQCGSCHALNAATANFCRNCGSQIVKTANCPACKGIVRMGDRFCSQCGKSVQ